MTGSVVQASAYKHPFVIHEDLQTVYDEHLKGQLIETHTDDADTFTVALGKLLEQLDEQNQSRATKL
jgi:hypothetical protein